MELMKLEEVAEYLRLNKRTIYKLIEAGEIPATRVGRQYRFNRAAIEEWFSGKQMGMKARILVIDDDEAICALFRDALEGAHTVTTVNDPARGLELVKREDYDLVFLDLVMPGMNGAELFGQLRGVKPKLPVTIITGYADGNLMEAALAHGPFGVMSKPFRGDDILTAVNTYRLGTPTR